MVARLGEDARPNQSDEQHQPYFDYAAALDKHAGKAKPVARRLALELEVVPAVSILLCVFAISHVCISVMCTTSTPARPSPWRAGSRSRSRRCPW